jgi:hypothetical protein
MELWTTLPPLAAALLGCATVACIFAGALTWVIIGRTNEKLPEAQQFSHFFSYPGKLGKIKKKYREFYPDSCLVTALNVTTIAVFTLMIGVAWALGFFPVMFSALLHRCLALSTAISTALR